MIEMLSDLAALTPAPSFYILIVTAVFILSAAWAVRSSEDESASERHFAYAAALASVLGILLLNHVTRTARIGLSGQTPAINAGQVIWAMIWIVGAVLLFTRLTIGWLSTQAIIRSAHPVVDREIRDIVRFCQRELNITTEPRVLLSERPISPFVTGVLEPVIVLTPAVMNCDPRGRRLVLLHEFAHIRRADCLTQLMVQVLGVFLWWNPLYWIAREKLQILREVACDEVVVSRTTHKNAYMSLIASMATLRPVLAGQSFSTVHLAGSSTLVIRLRELNGELRVYPRYLPPTMPQHLSRRGLVTFLGLAVLTCVVLDHFGGVFAQAFWDSIAEPTVESTMP